MKVRLTPLLTALFLLAMAVPAMAGDNGEGLVGETDDKVIAFSSFGVIIFFVVVVSLGSYLQSRLEKRKQARQATELRQRIGW